MPENLPEAEVTLRFVLWMLEECPHGSQADIAIDGAHVQIKEHEQAGRIVAARSVFDISAFLAEQGCVATAIHDGWRGTYRRGGHTLLIRSRTGPDVEIRIANRNIKAECKGGLLLPKGKSASAILASAVGQVITCDGEQGDELWVVVPDSEPFENAVRRAYKSVAFRGTKVHVALVGRGGVRMFAPTQTAPVQS